MNFEDKPPHPGELSCAISLQAAIFNIHIALNYCRGNAGRFSRIILQVYINSARPEPDRFKSNMRAVSLEFRYDILR